MSKYDIPDYAHKYIHHDMIEAYTRLPSFPDARAQLLYWMLEDNRDDDRQGLYTLAVSLAQLGLDTHDCVDNMRPEETFEQTRARQLSVLAGDYFNGRFYQLLARAGKLEIVRLVSSAICEVNRMKLTLNERLRQFKLTTDEYMEYMIVIRSELFLSLTSLLRAPSGERFPELLRGVTQCEIIQDELDRQEADEQYKGWSYCYMLEHANADDRAAIIMTDEADMNALSHKYKTQLLLSELLEEQLTSVKRLIGQLDSDMLKTQLSMILEPFLVRLQRGQAADQIRGVNL